MRRYTITVNDQPIVVDVEAAGANLFRVQLDGRLIDVTLDDHRDLAHSPITPALTPRPEAAAVPAPAPVAQRAAAPAAAPAGPSAGPARDKLTAPMPGLILSVDAAVGDRVARGEPVVSLEAMKMVNQLRAPRDGVVAEIYVSAGDQVRYGETLVRFEDDL
ncbi:MAG: acetyl-CoA carboxylase biotin carboxyl carrier protein subunit [Arachnia sp.]